MCAKPIEDNSPETSLMNTKRERLKYLTSQLDAISKQIQDTKREDEYLALVKDIAHAQTQPPSIDEDAWNFMLPKEQEINLLIYYHTMRAEAFALTEELKKTTTMQAVKEVLDSPYVKGPIAVAALVRVATAVIALGHTLGLFFNEDDRIEGDNRGSKSFFV
jgi:hypothetical protein